MALVSVIIPARDGAATIEETVRSVLAQTERDREIVLVDDGSTDGTAALAERAAGGRLTVVTTTGLGISGARNAGIESARGALITFIDADDTWGPRKLERQVQALRGRPAAGVAYSFTDFVDARGRRIRRGQRRRREGRVLEALIGTNFIESGSNAMVRREVIDAIGVFSLGLLSTEDWDFFVRAAARFEFACVPRPDVRYRLYARRRDTRIASIESDARIVVDRGIALLGRPAPRLRRRALAGIERYLAQRALADIAVPFPNPLAVRHAWRALDGDETSIRRPVVAGTLIAAGVLAITPGPLRGVVRSVLERPFRGLRVPIARGEVGDVDEKRSRT